MITILIALALLNPPAPPPLRAVWERPGIARIAWLGAGCLFHNGRMYHCYEGSNTILIGARGPIDYTEKIKAGDIFTFQHSDRSIEQAEVKSVLYFPVFR